MGKPTVVEVRPLHVAAGSKPQAKGRHGSPPADDPALLLALAAAVERGSTHPIAKAIAKAAAQAAQAGSGSGHGSNGSGSAHVTSNGSGGAYVAEDGSFVQEPGSGVTATVAGRRVAVGAREWVTRKQQQQQQQQQQQPEDAASGAAAIPSLAQQEAAAAASGVSGVSLSLSSMGDAEAAAAEAAAASRPGHILVYVGIDGRLAAAVEIADELRPDAASTVQRLQRLGVRVVMLSGDQPATAHAMAQAVGIKPQVRYRGCWGSGAGATSACCCSPQGAALAACCRPGRIATAHLRQGSAAPPASPPAPWPAGCVCGREACGQGRAGAAAAGAGAAGGHGGGRRERCGGAGAGAPPSHLASLAPLRAVALLPSAMPSRCHVHHAHLSCVLPSCLPDRLPVLLTALARLAPCCPTPQADVGIAMGGGVDAASEVADVVLLGDRVPQVGGGAAGVP